MEIACLFFKFTFCCVFRTCTHSQWCLAYFPKREDGRAARVGSASALSVACSAALIKGDFLRRRRGCARRARALDSNAGGTTKRSETISLEAIWTWTAQTMVEKRSWGSAPEVRPAAPRARVVLAERNGGTARVRAPRKLEGVQRPPRDPRQKDARGGGRRAT